MSNITLIPMLADGLNTLLIEANQTFMQYQQDLNNPLVPAIGACTLMFLVTMIFCNTNDSTDSDFEDSSEDDFNGNEEIIYDDEEFINKEDFVTDDDPVIPMTSTLTF